MADEIAYVGDTAGDEFLDVTFYQKSVDGKDVDFVNIKVPGDKTLEVDVEADDSHKARFRRKWEMYNSMQAMTGTLISEWNELSEGMKREMNFLGFKYVEQLAGAPDNAFIRVPGGIQWRVKAQAYLNRGKVTAEDLIKKQQEQIDAMAEQLANLLQNAEQTRIGIAQDVMENHTKRVRKAKDQP